MSLPLILAAVGGVLVMKGLSGAKSIGMPTTIVDGPQIARSNSWNLPDVDSSNQGGGFDSSYDESFEKASGTTGVPFALIKAHAIRESSLNPQAYHFDNDASGASYGLMQVEWKSGDDRFAKYGYSDAQIGPPSVLLYDPDVSALLGASIIRDNLNWLKGNLRDTINAYNTGTTEAKHAAPANYVDDVLKYYGQIIGQSPL